MKSFPIIITYIQLSDRLTKDNFFLHFILSIEASNQVITNVFHALFRKYRILLYWINVLYEELLQSVRYNV